MSLTPGQTSSIRPVWLVLEDDHSLRRMMTSLFAMWEVEPLIFRTGDQAMAWLKAVEEGQVADSLPEIALLDIRVPGPLGYEVGARIRQIDPLAGIPIVMMTAYRLETSEKTLVKQKVRPDMFLVKPLPLGNALRDQLRELIKASKKDTAAAAEAPAAPKADKPEPAKQKPPATAEPPAMAKVNPPPKAPPSPKPEAQPAWLLLEDDYYIGTVLALVVKNWDVRLVHARSLANARKLLAALKSKSIVPELAILDVKLPDGDGRDIIPVLHALGVEKIIVTSGMDLDDTHKDKISLQLGKPLPEPDELRAIASRLLGRDIKETLGDDENAT